MEIIRTILALPEVRYVAVYSKGVLHSESKPKLASSSNPDSDRYEELLVNPSILVLLQQRGNIDCGGLKWVLVR